MAGAALVSKWARSSSQPPANKKVSVDEELGFSAPVQLPLQQQQPLQQQRPKKKVKKSVAFAEELNEVYEVENWFDRRIHKHREIRFGWGVAVTHEVSRWIEPNGHQQLHFPRTKWVRDVPDWSAEDQDGDLEMVWD